MSTYSSPTKPGVEKYLDGLRPKPDAVLKKMSDPSRYQAL